MTVRFVLLLTRLLRVISPHTRLRLTLKYYAKGITRVGCGVISVTLSRHTRGRTCHTVPLALLYVYDFTL